MIGRISGQYSLDALSGKRSKASVYSEEFSAESDDASFSPFAMELAKISSELKNVPDIREDIVNPLKEQVEAGTYVPALDKVAQALLMAGLFDAAE